MMSSKQKKRLLRIWKRIVNFVKWCDKHGISRIVIEFIINVFLWWLKKRYHIT